MAENISNVVEPPKQIGKVEQIEDNDGKTIISEGLDANYLDIINYAVFAMIRLGEKSEKINA